MAFRNVYVQNDIHIKIKNEQLVVQKEGLEHTIPLEDINSICIESQRTTITTYALQKFIEHDIIVYMIEYIGSQHLAAECQHPFQWSKIEC